MKLLITGGLGFVGTSLIDWLSNRPDVAIRVLDKRVVPLPWPRPDIEIQHGDVCDPAAVARAADGVDGIVHLAAETGIVQSLEDPVGAAAVNVGGTMQVLEAARRVGAKVVFASSNAVLGGAVQATETALPQTVTPYAATKLAGEALCTSYAAAFGVSTVSLRFSNIYGPYSFHKGSVVATLLRAAFGNGAFTVTGDGSQTRDLLFSRDLAQGIWLALERAPAGSLFQIGSGVETSILDLARRIAALVEHETGQRVRIDFAPGRRGDTPRNVSAIDRARATLDFSPAVDLDRGLRETLRWFATTYAVAR